MGGRTRRPHTHRHADTTQGEERHTAQRADRQVSMQSSQTLGQTDNLTSKQAHRRGRTPVYPRPIGPDTSLALQRCMQPLGRTASLYAADMCPTHAGPETWGCDSCRVTEHHPAHRRAARQMQKRLSTATVALCKKVHKPLGAIFFTVRSRSRSRMN